MSTPQILVVEDEGITAMDLEARLKRLGYSVPAVVSSGEEAILRAEETHPDLVLMDIMLRGQTDESPLPLGLPLLDRKSTRLNSSHSSISYAVFCLKKKKKKYNTL